MTMLRLNQDYRRHKSVYILNHEYIVYLGDDWKGIKVDEKDLQIEDCWLTIAKGYSWNGASGIDMLGKTYSGMCRSPRSSCPNRSF